jgi:hypothetical protein
MKILLAEDNNDKIGKLLDVLRSLKLTDQDIDVAYTATRDKEHETTAVRASCAASR